MQVDWLGATCLAAALAGMHHLMAKVPCACCGQLLCAQLPPAHVAMVTSPCLQAQDTHTCNLKVCNEQ